MHLLQRKIFIEICQVFALSLLIILSLILMSRALDIGDMLHGLDMSFSDIALLFLYLTPNFLQIAAPIASMIAVFVVFLRLQNDKEMVAIRAGGISLYQLFPLTFFFSLLVMLLTLWFSFYGISLGADKFRNKLLDIATNQAKVVLEPGAFNKEIPNFIIYSQSVDPISGALKEVMVQDTSVKTSGIGNGFTIIAPEGLIDTDRERAELLFLLKNGKNYSFEGEGITILDFREYVIRLPLSLLFSGFTLGMRDLDEMSFAELQEQSFDEIFEVNQRRAYDLKVEINARVVFPFACIVLALMAMPLSIAVSGVNKRLAFAFSLIFFVLYFGSISVAMNLGKAGILSPYIGFWLPNAFFLLLAFFGIYYYNRNM